MGMNPPNRMSMDTFFRAKYLGMKEIKIVCKGCSREVFDDINSISESWLDEEMRNFGSKSRCKRCNHLGANIFARRHALDDWIPAGMIVQR